MSTALRHIGQPLVIGEILAGILLADALNDADAQTKLGADVKFYFGNQAHPAVEKSYGSFPTNKKTNSVGKSGAKACNWAFLSAMISLKERAIAEGGNAVINIDSYYKRNEKSNGGEFECHDGSFVTGVALKGEAVKLK